MLRLPQYTMPEAFGRLRIIFVISRILSFLLIPFRTVRLKFGRSNDEINTCASASCSCSIMSLRVIFSAVAVSATTGVSGSFARKRPSCWYSGRKSCPHCDTQCASSIAIRLTFTPFSILSISESARSGETYSIFSIPFPSIVATSFSSVLLRLLFRKAAGMPFARNASTWSFMSAMRGETTIVSPSSISAGTWKHSDLPPPVGISTTVSLPLSTHAITSNCVGRNVS